MSETPFDKSLSRRSVLKTSAAVGAGAAAIGAVGLGSSSAFADDHLKPLGNYPAGSSGDSVFIGIGVPTTGPYSAQGEDLLKGYKLAIKHLNEGNELIRAISPASKPGILGKKVEFGVADTASNPNNAVQAHTRFISENKAVMITGSVSSAVAIASEKLAQREKVPYLAGISGSNATTGSDCQRYGFRSCHYAYTTSAALAPVLAEELGPDRKVAYLIPDYTYGKTVLESMKKFTEAKGWKTVSEQFSPLGASDYSSYLLNMMASGADVLVNICFGADAVNSIKQAKDFGALEKMTMVVPYMAPFLAQEVGPEIMAGVYGATEFWWTLQDTYPMAKTFVEAFEAEYKYKPEWGAHTAYLQVALFAEATERAGSFHPEMIVKAYEAEKPVDTTIGTVSWRAADHQLVRPVFIVQGKAKKDMASDDDYFRLVGTTPGADVMPPTDYFGCKLGDYT